MTKSELVEAMKAKGILETNSSRDDLWYKAFKMHFEATRKKLTVGCGGCMNTVRNWLKS